MKCPMCGSERVQDVSERKIRTGERLCQDCGYPFNVRDIAVKAELDRRSAEIDRLRAINAKLVTACEGLVGFLEGSDELDIPLGSIADFYKITGVAKATIAEARALTSQPAPSEPEPSPAPR